MGQLRNQHVYLGTSRDDLTVGDLAFDVGYQYDFVNGTQTDLASPFPRKRKSRL
ncbi:DUF2860 domain-containing protein [Agarivorans sp. B2Z047]|nr:DUF2860 domain-containing protein [Agarivorans sp. B2Z047]